MAYDPKCYDLARAWLAPGGWTYGPDIEALAQKLQECCEDHVADLEHPDQLEREP